jgi:hypothetical protein
MAGAPRPTASVRPPAPWVTLALVVAFSLLVTTGVPARATVIHLLIVGGLAVASFRWRVGWPAILALVLVGSGLRLELSDPGSDVLTVTRAAIEVALDGGNPYGIGYPESTPPGAPFPYGPLALLWYLPPVPAVAIELSVSLVILGALALRGRMLGLAIYAVAPPLLVAAGDGANDTSMGLLLLLGLGLLPRRAMVGALFVGLAIAFKPTAAAWVAPVVGWAGMTGLLGIAVGAGSLWLPAMLMWSPTAIMSSIRGAATLHEVAYYSLAFALERFGLQLPQAFYSVLSLGSGALLSIIAVFRVRSADGAIAWGTVIFLVTMYAGFWSTFAYFAAIAPIICWRLDGWLGRDEDRVRWPGDPIGRLEAELDARWPAVESGPQRRL